MLDHRRRFCHERPLSRGVVSPPLRCSPSAVRRHCSLSRRRVQLSPILPRFRPNHRPRSGDGCRMSRPPTAMAGDGSASAIRPEDLLAGGSDPTIPVTSTSRISGLVHIRAGIARNLRQGGPTPFRAARQMATVRRSSSTPDGQGNQVPTEESATTERLEPTSGQKNRRAVVPVGSNNPWYTIF